MRTAHASCLETEALVFRFLLKKLTQKILLILFMKLQLDLHKHLFTSFFAIASFCSYGTSAYAQNDTARAEPPTVNVGDQWNFATSDRRTGIKLSESQTIIDEISETQIKGTINGGKYTSTRERNMIETESSVFSGDNKTLSFPLLVGKRWKYEFIRTRKTSLLALNWQLEAAVAAYEKVSVPAGEFDAFRIETKGFWNRRDDTKFNGRVTMVHWYAPAVRVIVKTEYDDSSDRTVQVLTSFRLQP
jgi:hypothetical protein